MTKEARLNVQGLARQDKGLMSCIVADKNMVFVSIDQTAGEPSVTTHLTKDRMYRYANFDGIGKKPFYQNGVLMVDDIYLMYASVAPIFQAEVKKAFEETYPEGDFGKQWLKDPEVIKTRLKRVRKNAKWQCVSGNTLIRVKDKGYVKIKDIDLTDKVWDGEEWVSHSGVISQGFKSVRSFDGVYMTPDHLVLTQEGWKRNDSVTERQARKLKAADTTWKDVWKMASTVIRDTATWKAPLHLCRLWAWRALECFR